MTQDPDPDTDRILPLMVKQWITYITYLFDKSPCFFVGNGVRKSSFYFFFFGGGGVYPFLTKI